MTNAQQAHDIKKLGAAADGSPFLLNLKYLNRHGLITGATGSGKTTTVKKMIEVLHDNDIPSLVLDIKKDLSSIGEVLPFDMLDFYGKAGKKIDVSIEDIGADALANLLKLSDPQTSTLYIVYLYAQNNYRPLDTVKDLYDILVTLYEATKTSDNERLVMEYGYLHRSSIATIIRKLNELKLYKNDTIFDYTTFSPLDMLIMNRVNIIDCSQLFDYAAVYSSLINYILNSFMKQLPEAGDLEKPKAVIFIDEAHLLFKGVSKKVLEDNIRVIKLIRSKGIGIVFISQLPSDIPGEILSQLAFKVQHSLNAYTEQDFKVIKNIARSLAAKGKAAETEKQITSLSIGQALISQKSESGSLEPTQIISIDKPRSPEGILSDAKRKTFIQAPRNPVASPKPKAGKKIKYQENETPQQEKTTLDPAIIKWGLSAALFAVIMIWFMTL